MYEQQNNTRFGESLCGAGDLNNDGYDDVIIGDMDEDGGRAYIYYGGANMNNEIDLTLYSELNIHNLDIVLLSDKDINGDGIMIWL